MRYISVLTLALVFAGCATRNEIQRTQPQDIVAVVGTDSAFTDKVQLTFDDKGQSVDVSLAFDEAENVLTLIVKGQRQLFGFRQDTSYKPVFHHYLLGRRRMIPERLGYPVLIQPSACYYLSGSVYRKYAKKRSKHVFNAWLGKISGRISEIPAAVGAETGMLPDSLVLRFRVDPNETKCSITLRNLMTVDSLGIKPLAPPLPFIKGLLPKKIKYNIVDDSDLNRTYNVQLRRNPCFGREEELDSLGNLVLAISRDYMHLHKACPTGITDTETAVGIFQQHRQLLLSRYPRIEGSSKCPAIQSRYDNYNCYLDSIAMADCKYVEPKVDSSGQLLTGISSQALLDAAHTLDNNVAKILVSKDRMEVYDVIKLSKNLVRTTNVTIQERGVRTAEQQAALKIFRQSERYFNNIILKQ